MAFVQDVQEVIVTHVNFVLIKNIAHARAVQFKGRLHQTIMKVHSHKVIQETKCILLNENRHVLILNLHIYTKSLFLEGNEFRT